MGRVGETGEKQRKTMKNDVIFSAGGARPPLDPPAGGPPRGPPPNVISGNGKWPRAISFGKNAFFAFFAFLVVFSNGDIRSTGGPNDLKFATHLL